MDFPIPSWIGTAAAPKAGQRQRAAYCRVLPSVYTRGGSYNTTGERMLRAGRLRLAETFITAGTIVAGAVSILSIVAKLHPALESIRYLHEAFEFYNGYVRAPLVRALGGVVLNPLAPYLVDLFVLWASLFIAVNFYVYRKEGLLVWGHIRRNYCFLKRQAFLSQLTCTAPKVAYAFLLAPFICVAFLVSGSRGPTILTQAYLTAEPREISRYLMLFFGTVAGVLVVSEALSKLF